MCVFSFKMAHSIKYKKLFLALISVFLVARWISLFLFMFYSIVRFNCALFLLLYFMLKLFVVKKNIMLSSMESKNTFSCCSCKYGGLVEERERENLQNKGEVKVLYVYFLL